LTSTSATKIICGYHDPIIRLDEAETGFYKKTVRIGSKNPNRLNPNPFTPFSTDGKLIFDGSRTMDVRDFLIENKENLGNLILLTSKEYYLIFESISDINIKVTVLELAFPIFDDVKYLKSLHGNFHNLRRYLKRIDKVGIPHLSLSKYFSSRNQFFVERKLRHKKRIDGFFYFSDPSGFQEVFQLTEKREDRVIVALDFNSMFLDCMRGEFASPKDLEFRKDRRYYNGESLRPGLYHVVFSSPKGDFIKNNHPFRYTIGDQSFRFLIGNGDNVEILAHREEIYAYHRHFEHTEILCEITSDTTISHPLARKAESLYKTRLNYKKQAASDLESLVKYELQLMHSATAIRKKIKSIVSSSSDLFTWLKEHSWIDVPESRNSKIKRLESLVKNHGFNFRSYRDYIEVSATDIFSNENLYSLSRSVSAKSRIKMFHLIERLQGYSGVSVCYANVDSVHVSIEKTKIDQFLENIDDLIGVEAGKLKIEAVADRAFWFDVGRYWLFNEGQVVAFKNSTIHHKGSKSPFSYARTIKRLNKFDGFSHVSKTRVSMNSVFSYKKKVSIGEKEERIRFQRLTIPDIITENQSVASVSKEVKESKELKLNLVHEVFKYSS